MTLNDRIFGILMLVLAVAYGWGATQLPEPFGGAESVGPDTFPKVIAVVLALSSLYLIVKPDPDNAWPCTRYDKLAKSYRAMITLACIERCL